MSTTATTTTPAIRNLAGFRVPSLAWRLGEGAHLGRGCLNRRNRRGADLDCLAPRVGSLPAACRSKRLGGRGPELTTRTPEQAAAQMLRGLFG